MTQNYIHLIHSYFNFHCIPIYSYKNTVKNPLAAHRGMALLPSLICCIATKRARCEGITRGVAGTGLPVVCLGNVRFFHCIGYL